VRRFTAPGVVSWLVLAIETRLSAVEGR